MTSSVHDETARIKEEQVQHLDIELCALDTLVDCIQEQNNTAHSTQERSFSALVSTVHQSYANIGGAFTASFGRVEDLGNDVAEQTDGLCQNLPHLDKDAHIRRQLVELRQRVEHDEFKEYIQTGQTPTRRQYSYPTAAPRTSDRATLMERMRTGCAENEPSSSSRAGSPSKALPFADNNSFFRQQIENGDVVKPGTAKSARSLRTLDINTMMNTTTESNITSMKDIALSEKEDTRRNALASLKRPAITSASAESKIPSKKRGTRSTMVASNSLVASSEMLVDRENLTMPDPSASVGLGSMFSLGRTLRSHDRSN